MNEPKFLADFRGLPCGECNKRCPRQIEFSLLNVRESQTTD